METADALSAAKAGLDVVFVDDFIGSGDQFLSTWELEIAGESFQSIHAKKPFTPIYVSLVGTDFGIQNIANEAPSVAVCVTHRIDERGTFWGIKSSNPALFNELDALLKKYVSRLAPVDQYMHQEEYLIYGYKHRGLFLGFEHSIPDATLPIFWCKGSQNWEPLIERT